MAQNEVHIDRAKMTSSESGSYTQSQKPKKCIGYSLLLTPFPSGPHTVEDKDDKPENKLGAVVKEPLKQLGHDWELSVLSSQQGVNASAKDYE